MEIYCAILIFGKLGLAKEYAETLLIRISQNVDLQNRYIPICSPVYPTVCPYLNMLDTAVLLYKGTVYTFTQSWSVLPYQKKLSHLLYARFAKPVSNLNSLVHIDSEFTLLTLNTDPETIHDVIPTIIRKIPDMRREIEQYQSYDDDTDLIPQTISGGRFILNNEYINYFGTSTFIDHSIDFSNDSNDTYLEYNDKIFMKKVNRADSLTVVTKDNVAIQNKQPIFAVFEVLEKILDK